MEQHSTCFGRFSRPSSGYQDCTYNNKYMSNSYCYLLASVIQLLKSSTCFEHYPAHLQEVNVVIVYMQPLVSSLSAGDCPVHRLRKNWSSFSTGAQDSHLQRVMIPEAAYVQLRRRPPEDEQGNARNM